MANSQEQQQFSANYYQSLVNNAGAPMNYPNNCFPNSIGATSQSIQFRT